MKLCYRVKTQNNIKKEVKIMKYVIYKNILGYCVTSNAIIDYYCKYFKWNREDFIIAVE